MKVKDLTGMRFGRLVAMRQIPQTGKTKNARWLCQCDCGAQHEANSSSLLRGLIRSCKCLAHELTSQRTAKHRMSRSVEWTTWQNMKSRCYNPRETAYHHYGGRGIRVCDRWLESFENFFDDMGIRPSDAHSIDRIDVDGDYSPGNCRWATRSEQAKNRRPESSIEIDGVCNTLTWWADFTGINKQTIHERIKRGVVGHELIEKPKPRKKPATIG